MPNRISGRPGAGEHADYYAKYIALVPGGDILAVLDRKTPPLLELVAGLGDEKANHRYAPDKWSVKEVLGHVADAERIFTYRALRIARGDATPLAGFEQNSYVTAGRFDRLGLPDLVNEFSVVRASTLALLKGFDGEAWERRGTASNYPVSVRAVAYMIAGHELHHAAILKEKYL